MCSQASSAPKFGMNCTVSKTVCTLICLPAAAYALVRDPTHGLAFHVAHWCRSQDGHIGMLLQEACLLGSSRLLRSSTHAAVACCTAIQTLGLVTECWADVLRVGHQSKPCQVAALLLRGYCRLASTLDAKYTKFATVASSAQAEPADEGWCHCLAPLLLCILSSFIHVDACHLRHQQAKSAPSHHPIAVRCIVPA